ncbi:MAG: DUF1566 domain-containing protein [Burkholderiaceae bacterium]|nr:DUF1566 domain-containing protein [Burkholderiaceae bacterium]
MQKPSTEAFFIGVGVALALAGSAATAAPNAMQPSDDGAHVIDERAKLVWARCVEGMQWDGKTCTGTPQLMSHAQASALAASRSKAEGLRWRLPRANELRRLVDKTAKPPGLDATLFPAAPVDWHWSSTVNVNPESVNPYNYGNVMRGRSTENAGNTTFLLGWAIYLGAGEARADVPKSTRLVVRLVRTQE